MKNDIDYLSMYIDLIHITNEKQIVDAAYRIIREFKISNSQFYILKYIIKKNMSKINNNMK